MAGARSSSIPEARCATKRADRAADRIERRVGRRQESAQNSHGQGLLGNAQFQSGRSGTRLAKAPGMSHGNAPLALEPKLIDATSFVGRDAEVAEVTSCLAGGWRLITLFGPPGVGKTRLARRVAHEVPSVLFVDLAD